MGMSKKREPATAISFRMRSRSLRAMKLLAVRYSEIQGKKIGYQTVTNDHLDKLVDQLIELGFFTEEDLKED